MRLSGMSLLCWAASAATLLWLAWIWWSGHLNAGNLLITLAAAVSLGLLGFLQLSGDLSLKRQDEGQQAAAHEAQSLAFFVAYFGILALWLGYLTFPSWQVGAALHLGILFVLVLVTYLGRLTWVRWRG